MLNILNKIIKIGDRVYVSLAIVLMMILIISVSAGIVARYFFRAPFIWTEELVTMLFIWISFLAAAVAAARGKLVVVDVFVVKMSPSVQKVIGIILDLLAMIFLAMVIIGSIRLLPRMFVATTVALNVPRVIYYIPVFVSSVLIFLTQLESLIRRFNPQAEKSELEEAST